MREVDVREIMAQPPSGGWELKHPLSSCNCTGGSLQPAAFGRLGVETPVAKKRSIKRSTSRLRAAGS